MSIFGLSVLSILGALMVLIGGTVLVNAIVRYRRTSDRLNEKESGTKNEEANTFASIYLFNGLFHIGWLLLILGGVGLLYYG